MTIEQQVVSLELSKKLKELGVKQESLFYWVKGIEVADFPEGDDYESWFSERAKVITRKRAESVIHIKDSGDWDEEDTKSVDYYAAFTVAELGEMIGPKHGHMPAYNSNWDHGWYTKDFSETIHEKTEADARAKILICLIEQGLLAPHSGITDEKI